MSSVTLVITPGSTEGSLARSADSLENKDLPSLHSSTQQHVEEEMFLNAGNVTIQWKLSQTGSSHSTPQQNEEQCEDVRERNDLEIEIISDSGSSMNDSPVEESNEECIDTQTQTQNENANKQEIEMSVDGSSCVINAPSAEGETCEGESSTQDGAIEGDVESTSIKENDSNGKESILENNEAPDEDVGISYDSEVCDQGVEHSNSNNPAHQLNETDNATVPWQLSPTGSYPSSQQDEELCEDLRERNRLEVELISGCGSSLNETSVDSSDCVDKPPSCEGCPSQNKAIDEEDDTISSDKCTSTEDNGFNDKKSILENNLAPVEKAETSQHFEDGDRGENGTKGPAHETNTTDNSAASIQWKLSGNKVQCEDVKERNGLEIELISDCESSSVDDSPVEAETHEKCADTQDDDTSTNDQEIEMSVNSSVCVANPPLNEVETCEKGSSSHDRAIEEDDATSSVECTSTSTEDNDCHDKEDKLGNNEAPNEEVEMSQESDDSTGPSHEIDNKGCLLQEDNCDKVAKETNIREEDVVKFLLEELRTSQVAHDQVLDTSSHSIQIGKFATQCLVDRHLADNNSHSRLKDKYTVQNVVNQHSEDSDKLTTHNVVDNNDKTISLHVAICEGRIASINYQLSNDTFHSDDSDRYEIDGDEVQSAKNDNTREISVVPLHKERRENIVDNSNETNISRAALTENTSLSGDEGDMPCNETCALSETQNNPIQEIVDNVPIDNTIETSSLVTILTEVDNKNGIENNQFREETNGLTDPLCGKQSKVSESVDVLDEGEKTQIRQIEFQGDPNINTSGITLLDESATSRYEQGSAEPVKQSDEGVDSSRDAVPEVKNNKKHDVNVTENRFDSPPGVVDTDDEDSEVSNDTERYAIPDESKGMVSDNDTQIKKPKDRPKHPLSAYNHFFTKERENILKESPGEGAAGPCEKRLSHGKVSFESLSKTIKVRWKALSDEERGHYKKKAEEDQERYTSQMKVYEENINSFPINQIQRSVDEIDGLSPSNSGSEEDSKSSTINQKGMKPSKKRASFNKEIVASIHIIERCRDEEKVKMFYTSKDLTAFRVDYIIELQEAQENMDRQKSSGSTLLRTMTAKFTEAVSCKQLIDLFCANPNRATI